MEQIDEKVMNIVKKLIGEFNKLNENKDPEIQGVAVGVARAVYIIADEFEMEIDSIEPKKSFNCILNTAFGYNTDPDHEGN